MAVSRGPSTPLVRTSCGRAPYGSGLRRSDVAMLEMAEFGVDPHAFEPCDAHDDRVCRYALQPFGDVLDAEDVPAGAYSSCGAGAAPFVSPRARSFTVMDPSGEDFRAGAAQSSAPDGCDLDVVQDRRRSNPIGVHPPELPAEDRHLGVAS